MNTNFDLWAKKEHPWYFWAFGISNIVLLLGLIASLVLSYWFDWWWNLSLACVGGLIISFFTNTAVDRWLRDQYKKQNHE